MFALVSMATADAIIASWDSKIHYNVWRPITAIREGENDGNPQTAGNTTWTSLFNSPNYPDYTSGANNVSAATTTTLQHLLGDKIGFTLFSNAAGAVPRNYTGFSDVARDVQTRHSRDFHDLAARLRWFGRESVCVPVKD